MNLQRGNPPLDMDSCRILDAEVFRQPVSGRTEFLFVRLLASRDAEGWGEATFNWLNDQVVVALRILSNDIRGMTVGEGRNYLAWQPVGSTVLHSKLQ